MSHDHEKAVPLQGGDYVFIPPCERFPHGIPAKVQMVNENAGLLTAMLPRFLPEICERITVRMAEVERLGQHEPKHEHGHEREHAFPAPFVDLVLKIGAALATKPFSAITEHEVQEAARSVGRAL